MDLEKYKHIMLLIPGSADELKGLTDDEEKEWTEKAQSDLIEDADCSWHSWCPGGISVVIMGTHNIYEDYPQVIKDILTKAKEMGIYYVSVELEA